MLKYFENGMDLKEEVKNGKVLVDFFATWCGPCQMLGGELEEIEENIDIIKVDIDTCTDLAREYGVMVVPTLLFYENGELISKQTGFMPKEKILDTFKN